MSYRVYKINNIDNKQRILEIEKILSLNWQDSINDVFISFDFEAKEELSCGDCIELYNQENQESVFVGIITKTNQRGEEIFSYSGYDMGFYLEEKETVIQFKNANISKAMTDICTKGQLIVGEIPQINTTVTKIYQNETLSDILKDLYKIAVDKGFKNIYNFNCKNGKINLLKYKENNNLRGYIANLYSIKSFDYINSFEKTSSIENMKNRIELYTSNTANNVSTGKKLYIKKNEDSIKKYGLLNRIEEVDADKKQDFKKLAENKLNEFDKISEELTFSVIGDNKLQAGTITTIINEKINIDDAYKIISSKHSIIGTMENVKVSVEKYEKTN